MRTREQLKAAPSRRRGMLSVPMGMAFGGTVGATAAWLGMQFGGVYGSALLIAVAVLVAVVGGVTFATLRAQADAAGSPALSDRMVDAVGSTRQSADVRGAPESAGSVLISNLEDAEWPLETHEVQVKLDLAREYLDLGETGLAVQLLQEALELEITISTRLGSKVLRETRQTPSENAGIH